MPKEPTMVVVERREVEEAKRPIAAQIEVEVAEVEVPKLVVAVKGKAAESEEEETF